MKSVVILFLLIVSTLAGGPPPSRPPEDMVKEFTLDGQIPMDFFHVDDTNDGERTHFTFPAKIISSYIKGANLTMAKMEK